VDDPVPIVGTAASKPTRLQVMLAALQSDDKEFAPALARCVAAQIRNRESFQAALELEVDTSRRQITLAMTGDGVSFAGIAAVKAFVAKWDDSFPRRTPEALIESLTKAN